METNAFTYVNSEETKVRLEKLTLGSDNLGYYLSARYIVETAECIKEIYIPKARISINLYRLAIESDPRSCQTLCNLGFGMVPLIRDSRNNYYYETILEEKIKEMTLEEIEKKLGHRVKIINK